MVNFYSRFNNQDVNERIPLLKLLRKRTTWNWDKQAQESFEKIKTLFSESVLLYFPGPKKDLYLETDASNDALGAVFYQLNEWKEKEIITLAIRTLKGPDITYFTTEKELLALV